MYNDDDMLREDLLREVIAIYGCSARKYDYETMPFENFLELMDYFSILAIGLMADVLPMQLPKVVKDDLIFAANWAARNGYNDEELRKHSTYIFLALHVNLKLEYHSFEKPEFEVGYDLFSKIINSLDSLNDRDIRSLIDPRKNILETAPSALHTDQSTLRIFENKSKMTVNNLKGLLKLYPALGNFYSLIQDCEPFPILQSALWSTRERIYAPLTQASIAFEKRTSVYIHLMSELRGEIDSDLLFTDRDTTMRMLGDLSFNGEHFRTPILDYIHGYFPEFIIR